MSEQSGVWKLRLCVILYVVKTTRYFIEQVLRKRSYIKPAWVKKALTKSIHKELQTDGRIRHWIYIKELKKYLRVVTLADGKTVHNAFPDRNFKEAKQ